jgi:hypothetical protein
MFYKADLNFGPEPVMKSIRGHMLDAREAHSGENYRPHKKRST